MYFIVTTKHWTELVASDAFLSATWHKLSWDHLSKELQPHFSKRLLDIAFAFIIKYTAAKATSTSFEPPTCDFLIPWLYLYTQRMNRLNPYVPYVRLYAPHDRWPNCRPFGSSNVGYLVYVHCLHHLSQSMWPTPHRLVSILHQLEVFLGTYQNLVLAPQQYLVPPHLSLYL